MQNRPNYAIQFLSQAPGGTFPLSIHDHPRHPAREIDYLHRHDCLELGLCLEGEGVFVVEGKIMNFRRGDYSVIDPTEAHLATSAAGTTSHWVWYYLDFERILLPHFPDLDLRFLPALRGAGFRNIRNSNPDPLPMRVKPSLPDRSGKTFAARGSSLAFPRSSGGTQLFRKNHAIFPVSRLNCA